ncbi:mucosa-associated lymphoid tissue lymphoma translocation protein 1-like isoform X2 [Physella acuta]|nr:mucosa-associated lymphoid tissue lymphoma translocation protein 1-like isoform X2 [Physella acuta]
MNLFNVLVPVEITHQPLNEMHVLEEERVEMCVKATGFPPPQYQWYKNGELLEGATENVLELRSVSAADAGEYCCAVYNNGNYSELTLSQTSLVTVLRAAEIEIKAHPRSCIVEMHGNALFRCEAWGVGTFRYQWFHNDIPLDDGPNVKGSGSSELHLYDITSWEWVGCYFCEVSRGTQTAQTQSAFLKLDAIGAVPAVRYTATDKVALLIGCNDYRSDTILYAPKYDVQTLSEIFQSLNFKVVSLLNLTKSEMLAAIVEFRQLVDKGVYCVFYFCGHGFEVASQCFLVPIDAPSLYQHTHCISTEKLFHGLLQREPQVCCMILDICRRSYDDNAKPALLSQNKVERGNAIVCYGTSYGLAAYENKNYGILVSHLKNILGLPVDIETVFRKLREDINQDKRVSDHQSHRPSFKQIPEIRTNLLEVQRSFADPIIYTNHTLEYEHRKQLWENAHRKPDPVYLDVEIDNFIVKVKLDFQQEFSNVLKIYTSVLDKGLAETCVAYVSGIPGDVAEKTKVKIITQGKNNALSKNYVVLQNIQRLKNPMKITVAVMCRSPDVNKTVEVNDLGLPLVAKLQLWKEVPELLFNRVAEEVEEEESISNMGF